MPELPDLTVEALEARDAPPVECSGDSRHRLPAAAVRPMPELPDLTVEAPEARDASP